MLNQLCNLSILLKSHKPKSHFLKYQYPTILILWEVRKRSHIEDTLLLPIAEIEKRPFKN
ncbi:hypothetical protein WKK05_32470 [Nostoc sp. UHCC 0302]|uniref:hypothetical protein n=1 Tax=Nostoc sp. UHCC 0302 TaxID=3134896 RepID=UPI00311C9D1C